MAAPVREVFSRKESSTVPGMGPVSSRHLATMSWDLMLRAEAAMSSTVTSPMLEESDEPPGVMPTLNG